MFQMNRIGTVEKQGQQMQVMLHGTYKKAMKHMESFSHIHLFVIAGGDRLTRITGRVCDIDFRVGTVDLEWNCEKSRVTDCEFPLALIDIKPYLPSEDYANTDDCGGINTGIFVHSDASQEVYTCETIGEIRNTRGITYLQYRKEVSLPKSLGTYI